MTARQLLDQAYTPAHLDALAAEPGAFAARLAAEVAATATSIDELAARDAELAAALGHIDATIVRAMKVRLEHALAADTSLAAPTRNVFAQTIVSYATDLALLARRARDVAARGRAAAPDAVAAAVVDAARSVLALRDALRAGVLALIRERSSATIDDADRRARDRTLDDGARKRWSAARRELEALAAEPARIATAPFAARLATHPEQLDEPAPEREPTLAELIELD